MFQVDPKQLAAAAQARLDGQDRVMTALTEEDFRRQEYEILSIGSGTPLDELFTVQLDGAKYGWLARYVRRVGLVRKLRDACSCRVLAAPAEDGVWRGGRSIPRD